LKLFEDGVAYVVGAQPAAGGSVASGVRESVVSRPVVAVVERLTG